MKLPVSLQHGTILRGVGEKGQTTASDWLTVICQPYQASHMSRDLEPAVCLLSSFSAYSCLLFLHLSVRRSSFFASAHPRTAATGKFQTSYITRATNFDLYNCLRSFLEFVSWMPTTPSGLRRWSSGSRTRLLLARRSRRDSCSTISFEQ